LDDGIFQAGFPNYTIKLFARTSPLDSSALDYVIRILDAEGETIEEVADTDFDTAELRRNEAYDLMKETYTAARRIAMGVDKALDNILSELAD